MANDSTKNKAEDSISWIVKGTTGKKVVQDSFSSYRDAATAAKSHIRETGQFAQAVRS